MWPRPRGDAAGWKPRPVQEDKGEMPFLPEFAAPSSSHQEPLSLSFLLLCWGHCRHRGHPPIFPRPHSLAFLCSQLLWLGNIHDLSPSPSGLIVLY